MAWLSGHIDIIMLGIPLGIPLGLPQAITAHPDMQLWLWRSRDIRLHVRLYKRSATCTSLQGIQIKLVAKLLGFLLAANSA